MASFNGIATTQRRWKWMTEWQTDRRRPGRVSREFSHQPLSMRQRRLIMQKENPRIVEGESFKLITEDFRNLDGLIPDESVDAIVTVMPAHEEDVHLAGDLSEFAARILKPDGHCFVMAKASLLDRTLPLLCRHLTYWWQLTYLTPGDPAPIFGMGIRSHYWPILWLKKDDRSPRPVDDIFLSRFNDERFHTWGHLVGCTGQLLERFTLPDTVVVDPFCRFGVIGVAAVRLGRRYIGIDKNPAETAKALRFLSNPEMDGRESFKCLA
jgi:hypothetical protein